MRAVLASPLAPLEDFPLLSWKVIFRGEQVSLVAKEREGAGVYATATTTIPIGTGSPEDRAHDLLILLRGLRSVIEQHLLMLRTLGIILGEVEIMIENAEVGIAC
jgi:hypothetical protein